MGRNFSERNINILLLALYSLVFLFSVAVHAEGKAVFGLTLGQPPSVPECLLSKEFNYYDYGLSNDRSKQAAINEKRKKDSDSAAIDANTVCYRKGKYESNADTFHLAFPQAQEPSIMEYRASGEVGRYIHFVILDGNVEAVYFYTGGIQVQDSVLAELVKKFGKPTSINGLPVGNFMGARFSQIEAFWSVRGYSVSFIGSERTSLSAGQVQIFTKKYHETKSREEKEKEAKRIKM